MTSRWNEIIRVMKDKYTSETRKVKRIIGDKGIAQKYQGQFTLGKEAAHYGQECTEAVQCG